MVWRESACGPTAGRGGEEKKEINHLLARIPTEREREIEIEIEIEREREREGGKEGREC